MADSPSLTNPDLTVYYSVSPLAGAFFEGQNLECPLYKVIPPTPPNLEISVGTYYDNITICEKPNDLGAYYGNNQTILYLNDGTIRYFPVGPYYKNSEGYYIIPANTTYMYEIVSGTGYYLNKTGFIQVTSDSSQNRKIEVYFTKTYTATASASASATRQSGETIIQSATASATSTVSAEDAYQIALVNATGFASALANASASEPN
jgi:hypothetical protein